MGNGRILQAEFMSFHVYIKSKNLPGPHHVEPRLSTQASSYEAKNFAAVFEAVSDEWQRPREIAKVARVRTAAAGLFLERLQRTSKIEWRLIKVKGEGVPVSQYRRKQNA